jgi:hypothetical protein
MNSLFENRSGVQPESPGAGPDKRWRVIFIGNHGKVVTFKRLKATLFLVLAVFVLALAAVTVLVAFNSRLHGRNQDLRHRLDTAEQKVRSLLNEKDLLTAQVVLVETKMKETLLGMGRPVFEKKTTAATPGASATADRASAPPSSEAGTTDLQGPEAVAGPGQVPAQTDEGLSADGLRVRHKRRSQTLEVQFTVTNGNPGRRTAKGYAVAVLKNDDLEPEKWLALPKIQLQAGRPTGKQKGHPFEIRQSKALLMTVPVDKKLPVYSAAILYLFDEEGRLLFVREFGISIQSADE